MNKEYTNIRVNTKIAETDYLQLQKICDSYGFKSIYQILQTLIQITVRSVDISKDYQFVEGVPIELTEMITDALNDQKRNAQNINNEKDSK